jgi:hypothetical protein
MRSLDGFPVRFRSLLHLAVKLFGFGDCFLGQTRLQLLCLDPADRSVSILRMTSLRTGSDIRASAYTDETGKSETVSDFIGSMAKAAFM